MMINVMRDPRLPNSTKTMVSYLAMEALPYDIPVIQGGTDLKLDPISDRASYSAKSSVAQLLSFYRDIAPRVSWKLHPDDDRVSEDHASLYVQDDHELGFAIEISQQDELAKVTFQRLSLEEHDQSKATTPDTTDAMADTESPATSTSAPADETGNDLQREIQDTVRKELQGVQDELKNMGVNVPGGILSLDDADDDADADAAKKPADEQMADEQPAAGSDDVDEPTLQDIEALQATDAELAKLPQLKTLCTIRYGDRKFELQHALTLRNPESRAAVVMFSQEPLDASRAQRKLARGEDVSVLDMVGNNNTPELEIELKPDFTFVRCFVEGASINRGSSEFKTEFKAGSRRLRGTVSMAEPEDVFDTPFQFEASFDKELLTVDSQAADAVDQLVADANYKLPVPEDHQSVSQQTSRYRSTLSCDITAPLPQVAEFYRRELTKLKYSEDAAARKTDAATAQCVFNGAAGTLSLSLRQEGQTTHVELIARDEKKARQDGIAPAKGQGLLLFANATDRPTVMTLNKRTINLPAGIGSKDPTKAVKVPVMPGKHRVKLSAGKEPEQEEVIVEAGTTWGLIAVPGGGMFAEILY